MADSVASLLMPVDVPAPQGAPQGSLYVPVPHIPRAAPPPLPPAPPPPAQPAQPPQEPAQPPQEHAQPQSQQPPAEAEDPASAFECNICLELAKDPVVTLCGHLYCWPCLFRWMQVQSACKACPVCKSGVDTEKVVPIYGRAQHSEPEGPASSPDDKADPLPARPAGQRSPAVAQPAVLPGGATVGPTPPNQGLLPALFGFQLGPGQGYVEALTPEQQHQAFLSRLLLMLGSFVIMCLLLF